MVRLREIPRTATFAWSTSSNTPQIVTGTKAGAVDADFSDQTSLEIWDLDFNSSSTELQPSSTLAVDSRFHAIAWSQPVKDLSEGIIAGALENGKLELWDAAKLKSSSKSASISQIDKHTGAIKAVQFNPHRDDLLASSGAKGELYITNIAKPGEPAPFRLGTATARADDFDALDWNKKVAHILVTGSSGGFATVWDVRAKKESINLNNYGRKPVSGIAWDPTTPTKVATATSSDQEPVILLWDLRNSNAPEKILRGHENGILSLAWSQADPRLLLSCGKDNRTICWNAEAGEMFGEFPIVTNWTFQTSWSPKHPGLVATGSFDGKISIQSIQSTNPDTTANTSTHALDGDDFFASAGSRPQGASFSLPIAPAWMKRPVSATFGFSGKLVRISPEADSKHSKITISTFVSESSVGDASEKFESVLQKGELKDFCDTKITDAKSDAEKSDWTVIETLISGSRTKLKEYLGFSEEDAQPNGTAKVEEADSKEKPADDDDDFFEKQGSAGDDNFLSELASSKGAKTNNPFQIYTGKESDEDKKITRALILGKFEDALDIALSQKRLSDAFMIAICGGDKCIEKAKSAYFKQVSDGPNYLRLLASVSGKNLWDVVYNADLKEWKEVMAAICTYADEKDFPDLCEALGDRIDDSDGSRADASFCYLAGSKLEKVVTIWLDDLRKSEQATIKAGGDDNSNHYSIHAAALQSFIEKVTIFRQVTDFRDSEYNATSDWKLGPLYVKYAEYADILASQGQLKTAERYLDLLPTQYPAAEVARNRVKQATSKSSASTSRQPQRTAVPAFTATQPGLTSPIDLTPKPFGAAPPQPSAYNPPAPSQPSAYTPMGYQPPQQGYQAPQQGYQPPQAGYQPTLSAFPSAQPFAPIGGGYNQYGAPPAAATPPPPGPPPAAKRSDIPSWNDTPDVGPRNPTRRGTPSVVTGPSPYGAQGNNAPPPRTASPYGLPPRSGSTPVPPPPKTGQARTMSPPVTQQPIQTVPPPSSSAANSYAPPPSQSGGMGVHQPTIARGPSPYNAPPSGAPPSNRYAPAQSSQPSTPASYGQGGMAPPRAATHPYGAPVSSPGTYGSSAPPPPPPKASGPPPGPPPKGPAPPKGNPPPRLNPQQPPSGRPMNSLPSPQQSNSRPNSPGMGGQAADPQHPPGDRSHIPPTSMPIFEILNNEMQRVKARAPQNYKQHVTDAERRLDILFDHLNNQQLLEPDTIDEIKSIAQHIQAREHDLASNIISQIIATKTSQGTDWMTGVKRLIVMSKATPL